MSELWSGVSLGTRLAYATGHVLNDVCASMWFTYLLVYFNLVLEFNPTQSGLVLLIGQVADALATPFVGYHSDKVDDFWFCKYGRRKTWHLFGSIATLATFPFIFGNCVGCENSDRWAQIIYYAAFVIIFQFGWAAVQISHLSLIPELTPNDSERTQLTALRYSFTVFSNVLVYLITWWSLGVGVESGGRVGPSDGFRFRRVVWIGLIIGSISTAIFHIGVRETVTQLGNTSTPTPTRSIRNVFSDINLYLVGLVYMATRLFVNLSQVIVPLYLHETLGLSAQLLAILPLCIYLSCFGTSLFVNYLNNLCGKKLAYLLGGVAGIGACVWIRFRDGDDFIRYEIYAVASLLGVAGSILLVTSLGLTASFIGADTNRGAFVYGLMSFTDKLSNGVAVMAIQHLHSETCTSSTYYRDALSYVCGGAVLLGVFSIFCINFSRITSVYEHVDEQTVTSHNQSEIES